MDELISRICAATGISEDMARQAIGIILNFLDKNGPSDEMHAILDAVPGAREMMDNKGGGGGGLFGGLSGMIPGMGAMGALNELTAAGLGMDEIKTVGRQLLGFAREKAGDEPVDEVIAQIPGLSQVL
ncbi:MAG: DUF2267 domain-containing protein [Rhodobacteraceae bacterium]|nr:DUF2267 domain-containing protein [Paracoccaceae bacterium]